MSFVVVVVVIAVSYFVVRTAAVALEITGLPREIAAFQALSAFSGTGFTTREAEYVVYHPVRRKIVKGLMVLGNAGIVSVVASVVLSLGEQEQGWWFYVKIGGLLVAVTLFFRLVSLKSVSDRLSNWLRRYIVRKGYLQEVPVEELLLQAKGYGVTRCIIQERCPLIGKSLANSGLRKMGLILLSVERNNSIIPLPPPDLVFEEGDVLVLYGRVQAASELFSPDSPETKAKKELESLEREDENGLEK